ncbi:MAG TPA: protein kinase [Chthoniobacterales bacterium]|nr:protein kinase [Chthoniobacterales bacterium]
MNIAGISDSVRMPSDVVACAKCGSTSRVGRGFCLSCLLQRGLEADAGDTETLDEVLAEVDVRDSEWRLGNYQILEEIGRGGMGVIYRARQRHSRRIVAVKRVLGYHADSRETLARFRREAQAAASLDHPNILPIYEVSESEDGLPFFSMKFAPGGSLQEVGPTLRNGPRQCVVLVAKIARAVQHAHGKGILHRDLKPGNILLDGSGEPLVSDFGLAKWLDTSSDLTRTLTIFGTPGYIAPEQASGPAAQLKPAADVYSLGAILFDLLAGRPPFLGSHALSVIRQAAETPAPKLRSLSKIADRDLETICAHCLEREPTARYRSAHDLAEDLERWLEGRAILARRVFLPSRVWRWSRRNPVLASTFIVCGVLAIVGTSWQVKNRRLAARLDEEKLAARSLFLLPALDLDEVSSNSPQATDMSARLARACGAVISMKTSSFPRAEAEASGFKWKESDLRRITLASGSNAFLLATMRRVEGKIRSVLTLVDAGSGQVLHREIIAGDASVETTIPQAALFLNGKWNQNASRRDLARLRSEPATATKSAAAQDYLLAGDDLTKKRNEENFDRGVECYRKAVAADPQCALALASLASALAMRQQFRPNVAELDESMQLAARAVEQDSLLPDAHRAMAVGFTMAGRFPEAVEASIRAFELDPTYQRAPGLLGALAALTGRPDMALRWFEWATRMQSQPGEYSSNIAMAWLALGEDEAAEAALRDGSEFRSELPDSTFALISIRLLQRRHQEVQTLVKGVLERAPSDRDARRTAAEAWLMSGKRQEAAEIYRTLLEGDRGISILGSRITYQSALGWICLQTGEKAEGISLLNEAKNLEIGALSTAPRNPNHLYSIAATCAALGETNEALTWFEKAADAGMIDYRFAEMDPRFSDLAFDTRFKKTLTALRERVEQLRRQGPAVTLVLK